MPSLTSTATRTLRASRQFVRGLLDTEHPLLVHIVPIRRCNLDCAYCNEYDKVSPPVPFATMCERIDKLAELGTSVVAFSGGEPLLHPELDSLIRRVRGHGMMVGLITNGFLLSESRIRELNDAGLDYLQISIDNVAPDDVSKKSLKTLDATDGEDGMVRSKLKLLQRHAEFQVNINSVLGGGTRNPEDARTINRRARQLGFTTSIGIIHDGVGQLKPLGATEREVYVDVSRQINGVAHVAANIYSGIRDFQLNLVDGKPNEWRCRAGARYLYICEKGLVHYCSQQRGLPGSPLAKYTKADIRREFNAPKSCAPMCTIGCVHRVSFMDFWRKPQTGQYSI
jgi:MoaA/NifB/PqqE/SkfB family radical SAM enzyme